VAHEQVKSFFAATDFAAETVYIEMGAVEGCFQLDLCQVSWTPSEISTDYTRQSRSYTERCEVNEFVIEARLIRIPDMIEADNVNSFSSSIGTGTCDQRSERVQRGNEKGSGSASGQTGRTATKAIDSGGSQ
jgi:hypothetical protein